MQINQKTPRKLILLIALTLLIMTTILSFSSFISSFANATDRGNDEQAIKTQSIKELYSPELKYCLQDPLNPDPDEVVEIYANLFDKYSNINNVTLFYSINGSQVESKQMMLINGVPSNGTYHANIPPPQKENVTVGYFIEARDELNYTFVGIESSSLSPEGFCQGKYNVTDLEILGLNPLEEPSDYKPVVIAAGIKDSDTGIENAKLYYRDEPFDLDRFSSMVGNAAPSNPVNYTMVEMGEVGSGIYGATIPAVPVNRSIYYYIEVNDYEGNVDRSIINGYSTEYHNAQWCYADANRIDLVSNVNSLDINDDIANIEFSVSGYLVNESLFIFQPDRSYPDYYFKPAGPSDDSYEYGGYLEGIRLEDKEVKDIFSFGLSQDESTDECDPEFQSIQNANNTGFDSVSIPLSGDPLAFPFDHYDINLMLDVPYRNITFNYTGVDSNLFGSGFSYSSRIENTMNIDPDCMMESVNQTWLCQKDLRDNSTITSIKFDFNRTYSIATVVVPIVGIFYLLGAIFLFENSSDNIGNRLTLTLGIFALIFTLPDIINSLKPSTSAPTIADSMLSIIIIATIAFTISSILSRNNSILQKWFPRHHSWADGIVFVIVSGFVISYFSNYLFDSELWWLIPLIIFGLGYGLFLRALGFKISTLNISKERTMSGQSQ